MNRLFAFILIICTPILSFANQDAFDALWHETLTAYELYGNEKYTIQEQITQNNHVLQAASIAKLAGAPNSIVIALLFHDIGQVIKEENVGHMEVLHADHAEIGGEWLEQKRFPQSVSDFVRFHALAKVMLCDLESEYYDNLSLASQVSHSYQKKKYEKHPEFTAAFKNHPLLKHYLAARKCDDMAKLISLSVKKENLPNLDAYQEIAATVFVQQEEGGWSEDWIEKVNAWHRLMIDSRESFEAMMVKLHHK